jgi:hypothetical protein
MSRGGSGGGAARKARLITSLRSRTALKIGMLPALAKSNACSPPAHSVISWMSFPYRVLRASAFAFTWAMRSRGSAGGGSASGWSFA